MTEIQAVQTGEAGERGRQAGEVVLREVQGGQQVEETKGRGHLN